MKFVRKVGINVDINGCSYFNNEYQYLDEALVVLHAVDDILSTMMAGDLIGEYNLTLSNERHLESDDEEEYKG